MALWITRIKQYILYSQCIYRLCESHRNTSKLTKSETTERLQKAETHILDVNLAWNAQLTMKVKMFFDKNTTCFHEIISYLGSWYDQDIFAQAVIKRWFSFTQIFHDFLAKWTRNLLTSMPCAGSRKWVKKSRMRAMWFLLYLYNC